MIIDSEGREFKTGDIKCMLEELHITGVGPEDISMAINAIKKDEEKRRQFIEEYKLLVKKYNIMIDSCGCCPPFLAVVRNEDDYNMHIKDLEDKEK